MIHRILPPTTLFCGSAVGTPRVYRLSPTPGGEITGQLGYMIRVLGVQTASIAVLTLKVEHGPDGTVSKAHSTAINAVTVTTEPDVIVGAAGTGLFAHDLHVVLEIDRTSGSGVTWITLEIFEIRKPLA